MATLHRTTVPAPGDVWASPPAKAVMAAGVTVTPAAAPILTLNMAPPLCLQVLTIEVPNQRLLRINRKMVPTFAQFAVYCGRLMLVDRIDRQILAELQKDGRLSITELAGKVGLSLSPCHRRLRELERRGVITGYHAVIDPEKVGLAFQALVFVTMRQEDRETLLGFEEAVARIPNVLQGPSPVRGRPFGPR